MTTGVYCTQCGNSVAVGQKFCTVCGEGVQPERLNSSPPPSSLPSSLPPISVATDATGELSLCPQCRQVRLVWEKQAVPGWALPMCIVGVVMIFTFILGIPGIVIWAIGMYGLLKPRSLEPYCPQCKLFFPPVTPTSAVHPN